VTSVSLSPATVESLFDTPVTVAVLPVADHCDELSTDESAATQSMVANRLRTYSTGRRAARQCLAQLGIHNFSLLAAPSREPIWPDGMVGSLSHTNDDCVAVVAPQHLCRGLGIDVERLVEIGRGEQDLILTPGEKAMLAELTTVDHLDCAIFSIKEAVFKSVYPFNHQWIDFQQANVALDIHKGEYAVQFAEEVDPVGFKVAGRFTMTRNCVVASAELVAL